MLIEYHYPKSDKKCHGDYYEIWVKDLDGKVINKFGDYYHDKGADKAEAFIAGIEWATKIHRTIERKHIADLEDYGDC